MCVLLQGLTMRQIRFRFDGQPINETDTPSQVNKADYLSCDLPLQVRYIHFNSINR